MAHHGNEQPLAKDIIIYGITFSLGFWVSILVMPFIKTSNLFVIYLLTGVMLELSAKICRMFLYNIPKVTLDKWFLIWVMIHSAVAYVVVYLIQKMSVSNQFLFILSVGFGIAIIAHIIWRVLYKHGFKFHKIKIFDLVKSLLALFTIFILLASIYLTFTSWLIGLFIPPIASIAIAGAIIRFFDRDANGKKFLYDTLALAGVFLLLFVLMLYQMVAPIFNLFGY